MVLLKDLVINGFVFYTNLNSKKGKAAIKQNPKISMCFHWKSLLRQIRIVGTADLKFQIKKQMNIIIPESLWK